MKFQTNIPDLVFESLYFLYRCTLYFNVYLYLRTVLKEYTYMSILIDCIFILFIYI